MKDQIFSIQEYGDKQEGESLKVYQDYRVVKIARHRLTPEELKMMEHWIKETKRRLEPEDVWETSRICHLPDENPRFLVKYLGEHEILDLVPQETKGEYLSLAYAGTVISYNRAKGTHTWMQHGRVIEDVDPNKDITTEGEITTEGGTD